MCVRPPGAGFRAALAALGLPVLLAALLPCLPARAGASSEPEPTPLEVYDPLFDEELARGDELERDPFEGANRATFAFNEELYTWVFDPLTHGYQFLVPGPARRGLHRFLLNLNSPVVFANEVLQLRPHAAGTTLGRFVANTTLGVGGIFDVAASEMGIEPIEADFGQTLARYGVPRGPYLVVPLFGPATARDAMGRIVDQALAPLTYVFGPLNLQWQLVRGGGQGLVLRDANLEALDALRDASVDYYAALRSAYLQSRRAMELEARWGGPPGIAGDPGAAAAAADPAGPVDPAAAADPAGPVDPAGPADPAGPVDPAAPVDPADPVDPAGPVDPAAPAPTPVPADQDSAPEASFSIRASMAAISASKSSRLTMPENSERRSASSLTVPSR